MFQISPSNWMLIFIYMILIFMYLYTKLNLIMVLKYTKKIIFKS